MKPRFYFAILTVGVVTILGNACARKFELMDASSLTSGMPDTIDTSLGFETSPKTLSCNSAQNGANQTSMRRLSKIEITNSLASLFGSTILNKSAVQQALQKIPDQVVASNSNFDNSILDVEGLLEVSQTIADALVASSGDLSAAIPGCTTSNVAACTSPLIDTLAYRAYRRPLDADEKQMITTLATSGGTDGLKAAIMRIILSPNFHQHVEIGEASGGDGSRIKLTQYEVASRIAFRLTGTLPDSILLTAAKNNQLATLTQVRMQAARLMNSNLARTYWRAFFSEWLQLQKVTDPSSLIANSAGIANAGFGQEAREELLRFAEYIVFEKKGGFKDLFLDKTVFPTTDRLAKVYGVNKGSAGVVNQNEFAGIILRPAKLISTGAYTSPILRGVYVRKRILCQEIPSPGGDIINSRLGELEHYTHDLYSNREITAVATAPVNCMGCHQMINPVGFALEKFGPLGTPQKVETVWSASGPTGITHKVNAYVDNFKMASGGPVTVRDADDLNGVIAASAQAKECMSQRLIEYTRYRAQDNLDNCLLNELNSGINSNQSIYDVLVNGVVHDDIFWKSAKGLQI